MKALLILWVVVNISSMSIGTSLGWTAPVIPKLIDEELKDTPLTVVPTEDQISWIGSLLAVGAIFGKLKNYNFMNRKQSTRNLLLFQVHYLLVL